MENLFLGRDILLLTIRGRKISYFVDKYEGYRL